MNDAIDAAHNEKMRMLKDEQAALVAGKRAGEGLLLVHTGDGKGKSTAAFGLIARALGWNMRVGVVQFIKGSWQTGEQHFFERFPKQVQFHVMGEGFTWDTQDRARDMATAAAAWETARRLLADGTLQLVVLDELNIALRYDYLDLDTVLADIMARPPAQHVCVTGRNALPGLIERADLVTEMRLVKHPFDAGIKAQRGVDF